MVLTHAHLDHCALVPLLYKYGYEGPVYSTPATRDLGVPAPARLPRRDPERGPEDPLHVERCQGLPQALDRAELRLRHGHRAGHQADVPQRGPHPRVGHRPLPPRRRALQHRVHRRLQLRQEPALQPGRRAVPEARGARDGVDLRRIERLPARPPGRRGEALRDDPDGRRPGRQGDHPGLRGRPVAGGHARARGGDAVRQDPEGQGLPRRHDQGGDRDPHGVPRVPEQRSAQPDLQGGAQPVPGRVLLPGRLAGDAGEGDGRTTPASSSRRAGC